MPKSEHDLNQQTKLRDLKKNFPEFLTYLFAGGAMGIAMLTVCLKALSTIDSEPSLELKIFALILGMLGGTTVYADLAINRTANEKKSRNKN